MATVEELQAQLAKLKAARASGAKSISYDNRMVTYRDVAELNAAIASVEQELAALQGTNTVRRFYFPVGDKGY